MPELKAALNAAIGVSNKISLTIGWSHGFPPTVVSNITTRQAVDAGTNRNVTLRGLLPGTTNSIVITDSFNRTVTATVLAVETQGPSLTIPYQIYPVTWQMTPGRTNVLWRISDLKTGSWKPIVRIIGTNGSCSILQTNDGAQGYWRVSVE